MTEDELRSTVKANLEALRKPNVDLGGFPNTVLARMQDESTLLLESSNRDLWLTWAVLLVAVLQLFVAGMQGYLGRTSKTLRSQKTSEQQFNTTELTGTMNPGSWCQVHPETAWFEQENGNEEMKQLGHHFVSGFCDSHGKAVTTRVER
jgi:hypothetical protein